MNKSLVIISLLAICLTTIATATTYYPNEDVIIRAYLHEADEAVEGLANVSIWFPNGSIDITNASMSDGDALGDFTYDYTFADSLLGDYFIRADFYNLTDSTYYGSTEDTYRVVEDTLGDIKDNIVGTTFLNLNYPEKACVNQEFTLNAYYGFSTNLYTDATLTLDDGDSTYDLNYSSTYNSYRNSFIVASTGLWNISITASGDGYDTLVYNTSIDVVNCTGTSVRLWEEVELKTLDSTNNYIITEDNYDKDLVDPYINDFAYILFMNKDQNATGNYTNCYIPVGSISTAIDGINYGGWLDSIDSAFVEDGFGCNNYWYRSEYRSGLATVSLPYLGNYSIYFVDGTMDFESEYSPPNIIKSDLFIYLGEVNIDNLDDSTIDFWVSHEELDWWATITDSTFLFMVAILPALIFFALVFLGLPANYAGMIVLAYEGIWLTISTFF